MKRASVYKAFGKRVFDTLVAAVALALLSPILGGIALIIWLDDWGAPLFRQTRVGRRGRRFTLVKFRSMPMSSPTVPSANARALPVTRVGRLLRRTNLDELPQLYNILVGDMSFVGPRPALSSQEQLIALRTAAGVSALRPGLTGLAQVNAYDGMPDAQKVEWESRYARGITLFGDLRLIGATFRYLLRPPPTY